MQFAKDSFYIAMRDRLTKVNPSRTVMIEGAPRPGILVCEDEHPGLADSLTGVFCLNWGAELPVIGVTALHVLACTIQYCVEGSDISDNTDRGRQLTAMDTELLRMALPASAPKCDYTQSPAVQLGSNIFWTAPELQSVKTAGKLLTRTASLQVYFIVEGGCA